MITFVEKFGGWLDAPAGRHMRQVEISRRMLAGEIDPHFEPSDFMGNSVAEQILWGGASGPFSRDRADGARARRLDARRPPMVLDVVAPVAGPRRSPINRSRRIAARRST